MLTPRFVCFQLHEVEQTLLRSIELICVQVFHVSFLAMSTIFSAICICSKKFTSCEAIVGQAVDYTALYGKTINWWSTASLIYTCYIVLNQTRMVC